ncbi:pullulanase-type alpha-1,6-glucosidase [Aliiglaciecola litoralis]|uniref:Glycosyl hydrolase family 13 catalytic domain-containing protein n=1 Tax=Aliiglaciecola litoralis TaxID=582857 RepID=A0ABN1LJ60_9ALTE
MSLGNFKKWLLIAASIITAVLLSSCSNTTKPKNTAGSAKYSFNFQAIQNDFAAHWVRPDLLLVDKPLNSAVLALSNNGNIRAQDGISAVYSLTPTDNPNWLTSLHPHLKTFYAYSVDLSVEQVKQALKQQLAVIDQDELGNTTRLSFVQIPLVLDYLYTLGNDDADEFDSYGARIDNDVTRFAIWAPTAKEVQVRLYDSNQLPLEQGTIQLTEDPMTGIWSGISQHAPQGTYYLYQIQLYHPSTQRIETLRSTDPYSLSLATNSQFSQVVDLKSSSTQPQGWQYQQIPEVNSPEELVIYETHVRDFSASDSSLSDPQLAGKYAAFSQAHSNSVNHLKALREAGLNTIHLLPVYDITTVNEQPAQVISLNDDLAKVCDLITDISLCTSDMDKNTTLKSLLQSFDPLSADAQSLIEKIRTFDAFNWGYDPYHYTVPEGSYALNPDGISRIIEFRQMVQRLHQLGFRVIMDVVYNHTFAAGVGPKSVLDKVVPNYYHRLNPISGTVEQSTCCDNTATEHRMMAKLMIDSLKVWAEDYKIDGFRFDLMGHQPKSLMLEARQAVRQIDPDTYFYGEGWNFGEVANNARFVQATQNELAGSEIGTFTDRLRDAVRGGSSFVSKEQIRQGQGLGNGLISLPNELQTAQNQAQMMTEYKLSLDQARIGLAGNLAIFPIENAQGQRVFGRDIDYGGAATGYALDPADVINYVSKHDNQTLWDNNQYRIASEVSTADRVRMQILSLAYPLMAQGIPFIHMGSELLRSKSFLRDSYDYGDWFNKVDYAKQTNNYNVGLPPAGKDEANWDIIKRIISQNQGRDIVSPADIETASQVFMDFLRIRTSTPLFSLRDADQIIRRVEFHNTGPDQQLGLIVMSIDDPYSRDLDSNIEKLMVIFNHTGSTQQFSYLGAERYKLHPVQQAGFDPVIKSATTSVDGFSVPALSVAVFVR